jgi:hypothetical protein
MHEVTKISIKMSQQDETMNTVSSDKAGVPLSHCSVC